MRRRIEISREMGRVAQHVDIASGRRAPVHEQQYSARVGFQYAAVFLNTLQDGVRIRKH